MFDASLAAIAGHPTVAWGTGPPLLVVPGLNDPLCRVGDWAGYTALAAAYCRRCARAFDRRTYLSSRPRGLRPGTTIGHMAAGYRDVLARVGPADVLGLSTGGFVAERLAAIDDRVRSLVFGLAADRLSPSGRRTLERWCEWAAAGEWARIYRAGVDAVTRGSVAALGRAAATAYDAVIDHPPAPDDFGITATACLTYGGSEPLEVPTLVVGGTRDLFFDVVDFERTAERHDGRFVRFDGAGHEALFYRANAFDGAIASFLDSTI